MATVTPGVARRRRAYVRVQGPDAVDFLDRMLSNDVPQSGSVDALLLTAKARVIAPVLVWRRGEDDVLLLTEPELGDARRRGARASANRGGDAEVRARARRPRAAGGGGPRRARDLVHEGVLPGQ